MRLVLLSMACAVMGLMLTLMSGVPNTAAAAKAITVVHAKIEIVWPHGNAPVESAKLANITAYLFEEGSRRSLPCTFNNPVLLWMAVNNGAASPIATGIRRLVTQQGVAYPVWDFNNVDVSAARDGASKLYFYVTVEGVTTYFNIWSHGADARTYLPEPAPPSAARGHPEAVDASIRLVWPHDLAGVQRPVSSAAQANVSVALFHPGTNTSVGQDFNHRVFLYKSINNEPMYLVGAGVKRSSGHGGSAYPVWDFNDVDVSAARDPLNKYYFRVLVEETRTFSTIWSHGADARTYFPNPDRVEGVCPSVARAGASVSISPTSGPANTAIDITARDFAPHTTVQVLLGPAGGEGGVVAQGRTDAQGTFTARASVRGGNTGRWVVHVVTTDVTGGVAVSPIFTVTREASATLSATTGPVGTPVQIAVRDFPPNEDIELFVYVWNGGPQQIGRGRTDAHGSFTMTWGVTGRAGQEVRIEVGTTGPEPHWRVRADTPTFLITRR